MNEDKCREVVMDRDCLSDGHIFALLRARGLANEDIEAIRQAIEEPSMVLVAMRSCTDCSEYDDSGMWPKCKAGADIGNILSKCESYEGGE